MSNKQPAFKAPSNVADRKKIKSAIKDIANNMVQIEAMNDHIKDVCKELKEEYGLSTPLARQAARIMNKQNFNEVEEKFSEIEEVVELIIK